MDSNPTLLYTSVTNFARPACDRPRNSNLDASPTGTDNSVVTLSEQRQDLVTGGSFDLTTIVPIGHPRRIGLFAKCGPT